MDVPVVLPDAAPAAHTSSATILIHENIPVKEPYFSLASPVRVRSEWANAAILHLSLPVQFGELSTSASIFRI